MFNYEQNTNLSYIQQQERIDEGERSRLAMDAKPTPRSFGALFAYALRKWRAREQASQSQPQPPKSPRPSTRKITAP